MELRPTALEDVPLADLLQQLSEAFIGRARVPVHLDVDRDLTMPSNVKIGFYRIVQEALNNIQKHARAAQVDIQLGERSGPDGCTLIELTIHDNGIGFDPHKTSADHFGLGIMEERAQSIGAQYVLESHAGQGTTIQVTWKKE